jgi:hypothetical protein
MKSPIKRPFKLKWHRYQRFKIYLTIEEFVNTPAEEIDDLDEDVIEAIIQTYSRDEEDDIGGGR